MATLIDSYAELRCRTNFSFLRGASHAEEYIDQASSLGHTAIAITDLNGVYAIPKAYFQKKKYHPKSNLKLIVGADVSVESFSRLTLLAENRVAYGLLCRILTKAHQDKPKGEPLLKASELESLFSDYFEASQGLIAIADPGCNFSFLKNYFSKERLYLPLSRFKDSLDQKRTEDVLALSQKYELDIVATNDVHFHSSRRKKLQDVVTAIREGTTVMDSGFHLLSNNERYLKTPKEMKELFQDIPQAIENTVKIADRCTFCPSELRYRYPSEWIPGGHNAQSYLEQEVTKGANKRYGNKIPEKVQKQLDHELKLTKDLGFADYFLTIYEIVQFARSREILCQGRGSAANSIICYCLEITAIDPVQMNLLFERFISAERGEPPDIDVDFEHERREEVIQHVYEKYGRHRAGMVSAVVTYRGRQAFREVSKAMGVKVGTLSSKKVKKRFDSLEKDEKVKKPKELIDVFSKEMSGFPRHLSIHSGGFTLSADPIIEIVPIEPARMKDRTIIQWDKYDLDYLGLLKVDLLCLGMLSAIRKSLDQIGMEFYKIPHDDPKTYQMIQKADTVGTFQIESRAQMGMLGRLLPENFYDLVIQVAIVRPGPIVGKMVHPYLKRRRGIEKIDYPHPKLKPILGRTLGVPLFQEQVMKMAIELAGFTPGEADDLRRAIGAWRSQGSIQKCGERLMKGLRASGLSQEFVERIFMQIKGFSEYGFPESHAASFALIAYVSSYIKCHYPAEFCAGLVNSQPMGFYQNHTLIDDAKRHGVTVLPIDPNVSGWDCTIPEKDTIRLGFRVVSGLSKGEAEQIISNRPYTSLSDFLNRTKIRKDVLHRLAMGGAFEIFGKDQRHSLWQILEYQVQRESVQLSLFSSLPTHNWDKESGLFAGLDEFESIQEDYDAFGLSTRGHPMQALRKSVSLPRMTTEKARIQYNGRVITVSGLLLVRQHPGTANGMYFSTLEDEYGFLDIAITPDSFEKNKDVFLEHCFVKVRGKLQRDRNSVSLLVYSMTPIWKNAEQEDALLIEPTQYFW